MIGCTSFEFGKQVPSLETQLARRHLDPAAIASPIDFRGLETVSPPERFLVDRAQVSRQAGHRCALGEETGQLGMTGIANVPFSLGDAAQHSLCHKSLSPKRDETLLVQILRMKAP